MAGSDDDTAVRRRAVGEIMAQLSGAPARDGGPRRLTPAELARTAPVAVLAPGLAVVSGASHTRALLADPRMVVGSAEGALPAVRVSAVGEVDALYHAMFSLQDGPPHARLRQVVAPFFSRGAAAAMGAEIADAVEQTWSAAVAAGGLPGAAGGAPHAEPAPGCADFDLVAGFADPLPVRLSRGIMRLPASDETQLASWARLLRDHLSPQQTGAAAPDTERAVAAELVRLREYARGAIADADDGPLRAIAEASAAGQVDAGEALGLFALLLVNGLETLSQALVQAVRVIAPDRARLSAVRAGSEAAHDVFREVLRVSPPLRMLARRAGCPVEIGGHQLAPGGTAVVLLPAAVAQDAEGEAGGSTPTAAPGAAPASGRARQDGALAYGHGKHVCLGRHHADLAGAALLGLLAARYERVALLPGARPHQHAAVNGYAYFPVRPVPRAADTCERSA